MYDGDIRGFKSGSFRGRIYGISRDGTAACIRRVRTKLHDNRKKHVWRTIAAALIGGVVLSGGIAYANSEGLLDKFFHNEQTEEVPEQYVEREYIEEDYPNGLKVITNAETKLTFEIEKAITTGDMVDVIWTVTYPDYDAEMYDVDFRMRGGDLYYGDQKLEETSSLILGEESDLKENQRMYDSIYLIPDGMELEEGDVLTMKFDGLMVRRRTLIKTIQNTQTGMRRIWRHCIPILF